MIAAMTGSRNWLFHQAVLGFMALSIAEAIKLPPAKETGGSDFLLRAY
jgi:hypothetical protein